MNATQPKPAMCALIVASPSFQTVLPATSVLHQSALGQLLRLHLPMSATRPRPAMSALPAASLLSLMEQRVISALQNNASNSKLHPRARMASLFWSSH
jgi:hypothetical protein